MGSCSAAATTTRAGAASVARGRNTRRQRPAELTDEQKATQAKALEERAVQLLKTADAAEAHAIADPTPGHQAIAKAARSSAEACGAMLTAPAPKRSRRS